MSCMISRHSVSDWQKKKRRNHTAKHLSTDRMHSTWQLLLYSHREIPGGFVHMAPSGALPMCRKMQTLRKSFSHNIESMLPAPDKHMFRSKDQIIILKKNGLHVNLGVYLRRTCPNCSNTKLWLPKQSWSCSKVCHFVATCSYLQRKVVLSRMGMRQARAPLSSRDGEGVGVVSRCVR